MNNIKDLIHLSNLAYHPDVQILCNRRWGIPEWKNNFHKDLILPDEVYILSFNDDPKQLSYTSNELKVICKECLNKIKAYY